VHACAEKIRRPANRTFRAPLERDPKISGRRGGRVFRRFGYGRETARGERTALLPDRSGRPRMPLRCSYETTTRCDLHHAFPQFFGRPRVKSPPTVLLPIAGGIGSPEGPRSEMSRLGATVCVMAVPPERNAASPCSVDPPEPRVARLRHADLTGWRTSRSPVASHPPWRAHMSRLNLLPASGAMSSLRGAGFVSPSADGRRRA